MSFSRNSSERYTPEQKTAYKVFYFCLSIVVVGTVILISSLRYSESNVVKEIIGIILVILGASLCYFMCLQIRRSALELPKTNETLDINNQSGMPEQHEEMAYVIVDSSGKLILHPLSSNVPFNERPTGERPLLIMSPSTREAGNGNFHNLVSSSGESVVLPWPLSMNRRRQLAQLSYHTRDGNRINNLLPTTHQRRRSLPACPPPYSAIGTDDTGHQSSTASNDIPPPSGSPPTYEDTMASTSAPTSR